MKAYQWIFTIFLSITLASATLAAAPFDTTTVKISNSTEPLSQSQTKAIVKPDDSLIKLRTGGYNIAHARGEKASGLNEIGKISKLKGIAKLVKDNKLDIIGFTEISKGDLRVLFQDQPRYIARYLGYHYVYEQNFQKGILGKMATQGNAIVSRYPIIYYKNHKLYRLDSEQEQRSCLETIINLGAAGKITVLVAHLSLKPEESTKQLEEIWEITQNSKYPVILCGDFNSRPKSERIKWISQRMKDTSSNLNTTYKNIPDVKIDYLFVYGPWRYGVSKVTGFDLDYSDHGLLFNDFWLMKKENPR